MNFDQRSGYVRAHPFRWARWEGCDQATALAYSHFYDAYTASMAWGTLPGHESTLRPFLARQADEVVA